MAAGTVEVNHAYTAQAEDEHSLRVGDIITDVVEIADGWCEGVLHGRKALFPDNFVQPAVSATPASSSVGISATGEKSFAAPRGKQNGSTGNGGAGVSELRNKLGNIIGGPPPSGAAARGMRRTGNKKVRVTHHYSSRAEDELSLEVGAVIDVLNTEGEEGWWEGSLNGKVGIFPSNFAEVIDDVDEKSGDEPSSIKGRKVEGVGFGNIFAGAPIVLRSTKPEKKDGAAAGVGETSKVDAGASRASIMSKAPASLPSASGGSSSAATKLELPRAKALFPYVAENEDELSLGEGDIIIVLDQELEDKGWWKGDLNGRVGVFPDNFVELLPVVVSHEEKSTKPIASPNSVKDMPNKSALKKEEPMKPSSSKPAWGEKKPVKIPSDAKCESDETKSTGRQTEYVSSSSSGEKISSPPAMGVAAGKPAPFRPPGRPAVGPSDDKRPSESTHGIHAASKPVKNSVADLPGAAGGSGVGGGSVGAKNNVTGASISQEQYTELQREIGQLREAIEQTKRSQEKRFMELMYEIDEEKKTRLSLQVELDRLKKFLNNQ